MPTSVQEDQSWAGAAGQAELLGGGKSAFSEGLGQLDVGGLFSNTSVNYQPGQHNVQAAQMDPEMVETLRRRAAGEAPSAAEMQMQAGLDRARAGAASQAVSNPNVNPALAQRMAGQQQTQQSMQANQQMGALRAQEQAQAEQLLAQTMARQAQMQQQARMANQQAGLTQEEMQLQAAMGNAGMLQQEQGGIMSAVGGILGAFSDERLKEDISDSDKQLEELFANMKPQKFKYKDQKHGQGDHYGFMAQDLEKSEAGKSMVLDTPEGKMVDLKKALMATIANEARTSQKLKKLEEALTKAG